MRELPRIGILFSRWQRDEGILYRAGCLKDYTTLKRVYGPCTPYSDYDRIWSMVPVSFSIWCRPYWACITQAQTCCLSGSWLCSVLQFSSCYTARLVPCSWHSCLFSAPLMRKDHAECLKETLVDIKDLKAENNKPFTLDILEP